MKKILFILISVLLFIPAVYATSLKVDETDATVDLGEGWIAFTRGNIKGNKTLEEYNITEEYMNNFFQNNQAYLDAVLFADDGKVLEMFIRINDNKAIKNASNQSDDFMKELADEYKKEINSDNVTTYNSSYKWVVLDHVDNDKYLVEYITIVNGKNYTFTLQCSREITSEEKKMFKGIIDKVSFDIDETLIETYNYKKDRGFWSSAIGKMLIYGGIGALTGGLTTLLKKKKKNENETNE